jgi:hypothetical protein
LPRRNEPDLDVVPESWRDESESHLVSTVAEVLSLALSPVAIGTTAPRGLKFTVRCTSRRAMANSGPLGTTTIEDRVLQKAVRVG